MDRLDRMQLFVRVVERRSFSAAAADVGMARSSATEAIKQLEAQVGARLLERTTRIVRPTLDGQAFYERCVAILSEMEEAENAFRDAQPRGLLRIDAHVLLTRTFLLPRLPEFLERYPLLDLHIGQGDRLVDLVREGVDCVIRAGPVADSGMIMRKLADIQEATCASPAYLAKHGVPKSPDALDGHQTVGFVSSRTADIMPLEFLMDGETRYVRPPNRLTVNNSDTLVDLARLGFGIIQVPRYRLEPDFKAGTLVEILTDTPPPPTLLSALYPQNRQTAPRLRVFLNWVTQIFSEANI
jgi:DNA-binding transcriptional LysR family regulator